MNRRELFSKSKNLLIAIGLGGIWVQPSVQAKDHPTEVIENKVAEGIPPSADLIVAIHNLKVSKWFHENMKKYHGLYLCNDVIDRIEKDIQKFYDTELSDSLHNVVGFTIAKITIDHVYSSCRNPGELHIRINYDYPVFGRAYSFLYLVHSDSFRRIDSM